MIRKKQGNDKENLINDYGKLCSDCKKLDNDKGNLIDDDEKLCNDCEILSNGCEILGYLMEKHGIESVSFTSNSKNLLFDWLNLVLLSMNLKHDVRLDPFHARG